jgi:hypothetical protein
MISKAAKLPAKPEVYVHDLSRRKGELKAIGGSMSDDWNINLVNQTTKTTWYRANANADEIKQLCHVTIEALVGVAPKDELEGMLTAQLVACHNASMECYRRAMICEQTFEVRRENLSQANKLSRTYSTLLEALNRHRGKGSQKVTVEHVHVHEGGQAIVGNVESRGGRGHTKIRGSTPCTCICTTPPDAEPGHDAGASASRQR